MVPPSVGETERDVVRELVIAQQQPQALVERIGINIAGRLPSQYVSGSLGQHGLETHLGHIGADPVGIDQFGIAKGGRRNAELLFISSVWSATCCMKSSFDESEASEWE